MMMLESRGDEHFGGGSVAMIFAAELSLPDFLGV